MKMRTSTIEEAPAQSGGCCAPTTSTAEKNDPCCEQPTDGSSCCDKTEAKEVNAEKTGCC